MTFLRLRLLTLDTVDKVVLNYDEQILYKNEVEFSKPLVLSYKKN
jgi:hypothetical protein